MGCNCGSKRRSTVFVLSYGAGPGMNPWTRTDEVAAPAYDVLTADELDELIAGLEPIAAAAQEVDD